MTNEEKLKELEERIKDLECKVDNLKFWINPPVSIPSVFIDTTIPESVITSNVQDGKIVAWDFNQ
jgi:archaellum component FlaC